MMIAIRSATRLWIGIAVSPLVGLALSYGYYRTGWWRGKAVIREGPAPVK